MCDTCFSAIPHTSQCWYARRFKLAAFVGWNSIAAFGRNIILGNKDALKLVVRPSPSSVRACTL
jgi:hypothetical protein